MINNIPHPHTSQELNSEFLSNSKGFLLSRVKDSGLRIFEKLYQFNKRYKSTFLSQTTLGILSGAYSRKTVNEEVKFLHDNGFIFKHRRPGKKTCEYFVHEFFFTPQGRSLLKKVFTIFISFQLSLLMSTPRVTQLSLTNITANKKQRASENLAADLDVTSSIYIKKETAAPHMSGSVERIFKLTSSFASTIPTSWYAHGCLSGQLAPLSKNIEESSMFNFTQDQLEQIAQYSQEAIARAATRLRTVTSQGRSPVDPFTWFLAICRNYRPNEEVKEQSPFKKNKNQTPKTGNIRASNNSHSYLRTKDNWIEDHHVVQTPNTRQSTVKRVEGKMEWAINVERTLHDRYLNDNSFAKGAAKFANPHGELIPQSILDEIHHDCDCRRNVTKELSIKVQEAIIKDV